MMMNISYWIITLENLEKQLNAIQIDIKRLKEDLKELENENLKMR